VTGTPTLLNEQSSLGYWQLPGWRAVQ